MLVSQILEQFYKQHSTYRNIGYSQGNVQYREHLHPLLVFTQYIIDTLIANGEKRIAVVLPDDDCEILPLILAKCFANIQDEPGFAGSVLEEIEPGQMLRLGDAVVRYLGREGDGKIVYSVGRKQLTMATYYCPISEYHNFFEKCTGAVSSLHTYQQAKKKIDEMIKSGDNNELNAIKLKRTTIKKTTLLLSAKNAFHDFMGQLKINNCSLYDIITYGEIDLHADSGFMLYNKGKLDCLPAITVSAKLDEINDALQIGSIAKKVGAIFSTVDKFDELTDNSEALKGCLRKGIPFIAFVPEHAFEKFTIIKNLGFKMWHWKPATLKSEVFLRENVSDRQERIFGAISRKISSAALAEYDFVSCTDNKLKTDLCLIKDISFKTNVCDATLKQLVRRLWGFQNEMVAAGYIDNYITTAICSAKETVSFTRTELNIVKKYFLLQHYRTPRNRMSYTNPKKNAFELSQYNLQEGESKEDFWKREMLTILEHDMSELVQSDMIGVRKHAMEANSSFMMIIRTNNEFCINDIGYVTERMPVQIPKDKEADYIKTAKEIGKELYGQDNFDELARREIANQSSYFDNYVFHPISSNCALLMVSPEWKYVPLFPIF